MQDNNNKCPNSKRLRQLIDQIANDDPTDREIKQALEWLATSLENRSLYHKRQQLKRKIMFELGKEHPELLEQAEKLAETALFDHIQRTIPGEPIPEEKETENE